MGIPMRETGEFGVGELGGFDEIKETLKLTKNARGNYQWEIKVKSLELNKEDVARLDIVVKELESKYGEKKE